MSTPAPGPTERRGQADQVEDRFVRGTSATFLYRRLGPREGLPLVLVNRFLGTIDWWDPWLLDELAAHHDVVVFDAAGVGGTDGETSDTLEGQADAVADLLLALGPGPVDLLGWTLGGAVALEVARRHPQLVRRLVVAAANPGGRVPHAPGPDPIVREILSRPPVSPDNLVRLFFPDTEDGRAAGHDYLQRVARRLAQGRPGVSPESARAQAAAIAASGELSIEMVRDHLRAVTRPVLYATGIRDIMTPALVGFHAVEHLPDATFLAYGDAGHAFLFHHPSEFAAQVRTFLTA